MQCSCVKGVVSQGGTTTQRAQARDGGRSTAPTVQMTAVKPVHRRVPVEVIHNDAIPLALLSAIYIPNVHTLQHQMNNTLAFYD